MTIGSIPQRHGQQERYIRTDPGTLSQDRKTLGHLEEYSMSHRRLWALMICSSSRKVSVNRKANHFWAPKSGEWISIPFD
jgi:hypothetical protein